MNKRSSVLRAPSRLMFLLMVTRIVWPGFASIAIVMSPISKVEQVYGRRSRWQEAAGEMRRVNELLALPYVLLCRGGPIRLSHLFFACRLFSRAPGTPGDEKLNCKFRRLETVWPGRPLRLNPLRL